MSPNSTGDAGGLSAAQEDLLLMYHLNHAVHEPWHTLFSLAYLVVIAAGFLTNGLVIAAIFRKRDVSSPRNIFILNLAVADLREYRLHPNSEATIREPKVAI